MLEAVKKLFNRKERVQERPTTSLREIDSKNYQKVHDSIVASREFHQAFILEFKDISQDRIVLNEAAGPCISFFVEVDGSMRFTGHFPLTPLQENSDDRDRYTRDKFNKKSRPNQSSQRSRS